MNLQDRIYILDGATGTALQQFRLTETDFPRQGIRTPPDPPKGKQRCAEYYPPGRDSSGTSKLY